MDREREATEREGGRPEMAPPPLERPRAPAKDDRFATSDAWRSRIDADGHANL